MNRQQAQRILSGESRSPLAALTRAGLGLAEPLYRAAVEHRNRKFDARPATPLGLPTLSVGNLTTGGTGKTPMVIDLARRLIARGRAPAILLRGYKAAAGRSDEAAELQDALPGVAVIANPSRIDGANQAMSKCPGADCFILDDGFQHRRAARDLDLVLIDATNPWGFGHLLPRGLLREPKANLARADHVIITRADQVEPDALAAIDREVEQLTGRPPLAHATHRWSQLRCHGDERALPIDHLATGRVVAVSAIGNPAAFERTLAGHCREVIAHHRFDDHHAYTAAQLAELITAAAKAGADALVTTEKDYVKWRPLLATGAVALPVLRPILALSYLDGEAATDALLADLTEQHHRELR